MLNWKDHIHSDQNISLGKPTIKDTRISIELILELYSLSWTSEQIIESYPTLKQEDLLATFMYLKDSIGQELFSPIQQAS